MKLLSPKMDSKMDNKNLTHEIDRASKRDSKTSGKPKFDKFNVEVKITNNFEFIKGMEFSSLQQFKDAVLEHNLLNGRKIKFAKNDRSRVRAVCKFSKKCGYLILVSKVINTTIFRVKTLCLKHTCGRVVANKSYKSSKLVAKHNNKEEQSAKQQLPVQGSSTTASKKRERSKRKTQSNVKPNEPTRKKSEKGLNVCSSSKKTTKALEQQQAKVLVDGEPLNQNQEDMLAGNTFVEPDSAVNLVPTSSGPVPSNGKKRKKEVTRKLNLKKVRTSDRLRALTVRRRVYDGPGSDATSPIVIDDEDVDDDGELYDPKVGSCMHALRNWNEIS